MGLLFPVKTHFLPLDWLFVEDKKVQVFDKAFKSHQGEPRDNASFSDCRMLGSTFWSKLLFCFFWSLHFSRIPLSKIWLLCFHTVPVIWPVGRTTFSHYRELNARLFGSAQQLGITCSSPVRCGWPAGSTCRSYTSLSSLGILTCKNQHIHVVNIHFTLIKYLL